MRKTHNLSLKLSIVIAMTILLSLTGNRILSAGKKMYRHYEESIVQGMLLQAEKFYNPGVFFYQYHEKKNVSKVCDTLFSYMDPLSAFLEEKKSVSILSEDPETCEMILARQEMDENMIDEKGELIGDEDPVPEQSEVDTDWSEVAGYDMETLISQFYTVDHTTMVSDELLNAKELLAKNMAVDQSGGGPKILIYHTHSQEDFADSIAGDPGTTILGMGAYLTELLNAKGIETLHHEGVYDLIDGKMDRSKAYQLAKPQIEKILGEYPGIEVVIDLHRDGVGKDTHLVTDIGGRQTAQIMFFNGLSQTKKNGPIAYLNNPYIKDNLALSLQMQLMAAKMYPGFTRRIYLKGYRYNLHLKPKSMLIEAGAQTNTVEEMRNAMELLANVLARVLVP